MNSVTPVGRASLPSYPTPVTAIGGPAIRLPSPTVPVVSLPGPGIDGGRRIAVAAPAAYPRVDVPVVVPTVAELPHPAMPDVAPIPRLVLAQLGPNQNPRPANPTPDPLPTPVPMSLSPVVVAAARPAASLQKAAARLNALFDSTEKPAPAPVELPQERKPEIKKENERVPERRISLPEWDLENEIGINSVGSNW